MLEILQTHLVFAFCHLNTAFTNFYFSTPLLYFIVLLLRFKKNITMQLNIYISDEMQRQLEGCGTINLY
jgi:predicted component of viral defense system (DUF524 family)